MSDICLGILALLSANTDAKRVGQIILEPNTDKLERCHNINTSFHYKSKELYVFSRSTINVNDYFSGDNIGYPLSIVSKCISKGDNVTITQHNIGLGDTSLLKVSATTDIKLINDGVPAIEDSFIDSYINEYNHLNHIVRVQINSDGSLTPRPIYYNQNDVLNILLDWNEKIWEDGKLSNKDLRTWFKKQTEITPL